MAPARKTRPREFYLRAALAGLAGGMMGLVGLLLWQAAAGFRDNALLWLPYPYPRQGSEGLILYQALLLRAGEDLYGPITPTSFISAPYPPVYYWLAGQVMPAGQAELFDGRSISLWAAIAAAVAAGLVVLAASAGRDRPDGGSPSARVIWGLAGGLVAAGVWLAQPAAQIWSTRFRPDMLMVGFMAAGLCFVSLAASLQTGRREDGRPGWVIWLALPAFVLAVYTKQTALAGPMAVAIFLFLRHRRTGVTWTLSTIGAGLVPFAVLEIATGHWFYLKMVDYHNLPFDPRTLGRLTQGFWEDQGPLVIAGAGYLAWRVASRKLDLAALFLLANVLLLPTGGVIGADSNHFLSIGLALAICAGAAVAAAGPGLSGAFVPGGRVSWRPLASLLLVGALVSAFVPLAARPADRFRSDRMLSAEEQEQMRLIIEMARGTPGEIFFADDPGILALAGKRTAYDDIFTVTALAAAGRWDQSALLEQLGDGRFPLVLLGGNAFAGPDEPRPLRSDIMSREMVAALCAGYRVLYRDVVFTYAPREGSKGRMVDGRCRD